MNDSLFTTEEGRRFLVAEVFPSWLPQQRWFGGKGREPRAFRLVRQAALGDAWLLGVEVVYRAGPPETYLVPLRQGRRTGHAIVPPLADGTELAEAIHDADFRAFLFQLLAGRAAVEGLRGEPGTFLQQAFPGDPPPSRVLKAEQSNTSLIYGDRLFVKLYRRLVPGVNPDAEMTRHLSETCGYRNVPAFGGAVEWDGCSLALATATVAHECDAWEQARRILSAHPGGRPGAAGQTATSPARSQKGRRTSGDEADARAQEWFSHVEADSRAAAFFLGQRTGEMHLALARGGKGAEFSAEPFRRADAEALAASMLDSLHRLCDLLRERATSLSPVDDVRARQLTLFRRDALREQILLATAEPCGVKTRIHGDYHLGQVLYTGEDYVILDFEGEPLRTLEERRARSSPLRDVAGMIRSYHYAASAYFKTAPTPAPGDELWADRWANLCADAFTAGWNEAVSPDPGLRELAENGQPLLRAYVLQKAMYEVIYEVNNRPDWLGIPLRGVLSLVEE